MTSKYMIAGIIAGAIAVGVWYVMHCDLSCEADKKRAGAETFIQINAQNFKEQSAGATMFDVRTPEEYVTGHIPGAALVDISGGDFKVRIGQFDRTLPYYVYCQSGSRSSVALDIMKSMGFKKVYGLQGGISAWRKAGFPIE